MMVNFPQPAEETIEQSMKPSMRKQKELCYIKALQKGGVEPQIPSILMSWLS